MNRLRGSGGFTLVELQVALVIIALMSVLMVGALRLASRTWTAVVDRQDRAEHRYLTTNLLRRHLSNARFFEIDTDNGHSGTSFIGDSERVHFVAPFPSFANNGELYWWTLERTWNPEREVDELLLSYFLFDADDLITIDSDGQLIGEDVEPSVLLLADNIVDLDLEYFFRDEEGLEYWIDEWELRSETPLVIRLRLTEGGSEYPGTRASGQGEKAIPELIVSPRYAKQKLFSEVDRNR